MVGYRKPGSRAAERVIPGGTVAHAGAQKSLYSLISTKARFLLFTVT